jgi:capsid portal protein
MAEGTERNSGVKALSLGPGGTRFYRDWTQPTKITDPFYRKYTKLAWRLEVPPLGGKSLEQMSALLLSSTDFSVTVGQISTDVSGLGLHIVPIKKELASQENLFRGQAFFEECNPDDTFREIASAVNMDWESTGNGYIECTRKGNIPTNNVERLDHVPSKEVRITIDMRNFCQIRGNKKIWFRRFGSDPDDERSKDPSTGELLNEMLWWRHYHSYSPVYGIPKIVPALAAVRGYQYQADRNIKFFFNRTLPEWCLMVKGDLVGAEKELEVFRENIGNHLELMLRGDHYRLLYLEIPKEIELEWKKLGPDHKDADFREYRKDNRDEILRSYGMLPHRVGIIETGNIGTGTGETQIEVYKASVVKPRQETWEKKLANLMREGLSIRDHYAKFDEIDTLDEEREAGILAKIGALPFLTINEGREWITKYLKMRLPELPQPWADYPFQIIQAQLATLDIGIRRGEITLDTVGEQAMSMFPSYLALLDPQAQIKAMAMYSKMREAIGAGA